MPNPMKPFYFLVIIGLLVSTARASEGPLYVKNDGKLTIKNEFYSEIEVDVYRGDSKDTPPSLRHRTNKIPIRLGVNKDTTLVFADLKKPAFFWVDITFSNTSTWSIDAIRLEKDKSEIFTVRKDLFGLPLKESSERFYDEMLYDFYSDIVILEQNVQNQDEQLKTLFGGLAIVTIDYEKDISNRINYMESGILKREISLDTVFSQGNVKRYEYIFKDSFLLDESKSRLRMVPGVKDFRDVARLKGHLYKISYAIKGLESDIAYVDERDLEKRWAAIKPDNLKEFFLEDFIAAFQKSTLSESVEVREYNRASGYKLMSVEIDEYGPNPERADDRVALITTEGPYFLQRERIYEDLQGQRILALGYDGLGVDHTEWITQQAIKHLDKLMEMRSNNPSFYLNKLNKLGIQGYYQVNRAEYVNALKALKLEMSK